MKQRYLILLCFFFLTMYPVSALFSQVGNHQRVSSIAPTARYEHRIAESDDKIITVWSDLRFSQYRTFATYNDVHVFAKVCTLFLNNCREFRASPGPETGAPFSAYPGVAAQGNRIYIVWVGNSASGANDLQVYLRIFDENGNPLSDRIQVDDGGAQWIVRTNPQIIIAGGLHIAWITDGGLRYQRMTLDGQRIDGNVLVTTEYLPFTMAAAPSNVIYFFFLSQNYRELRYLPYLNGQPQQPPRLFTLAGSSIGFHFEAAVDGQSNIIVAWDEYNFGVNGEAVYIQAIRPDGTVILPKQTVTEQRGDQYQVAPTITVDSNERLGLSWTDSSPGTYQVNIFYEILGPLPEAAILVPPTAITASNYEAYSHAVFDSQDSFHLIWAAVNDENGINAFPYYHPAVLHAQTFKGTINVFGNTNPGRNVLVRLTTDRSFAGRPYLLAASTGNEGFKLGSTWVPIDPDQLFFLSLLNLVGFPSSGVFDANGEAGIQWNIPPDAPYGTLVYLAFITQDDRGNLHTSHAKRVTAKQGVG